MPSLTRGGPQGHEDFEGEVQGGLARWEVMTVDLRSKGRDLKGVRRSLRC